jgi:RHH-type proline utilization regulon transcriptional repressor/proline dehydrogenase/delta 1-pyrroline-5-carboxylate dehydrogenase
MANPVDPSGLAAESNVFRYRPLRSVVLCCGAGTDESETRLAMAAAGAVGVSVLALAPGELRDRVDTLHADKVRFLGPVDDAIYLAAFDAGLWVDDIPVAADPRREILRWVREQAVSESRHRHGNVTGRRPGLAGWSPGDAG